MMPSCKTVDGQNDNMQGYNGINLVRSSELTLQHFMIAKLKTPSAGRCSCFVNGRLVFSSSLASLHHHVN